MAIVYRHRREDNGDVFYVGIGVNKKRAFSLLSRNKFWKDMIKNHIYKVEIVSDNINWKEACQIEKYLISFYGRRDLGLGTLVNLTDGGEGIPGCKKIITEEFKEKCRENMSGLTWEERFGKEKADILKANMAERAKSEGRLTEYVKKNGAPCKGRKLGPCTEERNKNASIALKKAFKNISQKKKDSRRKNFKINNPTKRKVICEHCSKEIGYSHYKQWHGDKCKFFK